MRIDAQNAVNSRNVGGVVLNPGLFGIHTRESSVNDYQTRIMHARASAPVAFAKSKFIGHLPRIDALRSVLRRARDGSAPPHLSFSLAAREITRLIGAVLL